MAAFKKPAFDGTNAIGSCPFQDFVSRSRLLIAFAVVYLAWGSTYLVIALALDSFPPFVLAALRFLLAGGLMVGFARWRGATWPNVQEWAAGAVVGGLLFVVGNGTVNWSETRIDSGLAALIVSTVPLWLVALAWARGERPTGLTGAGLALGVLGIVLLVGNVDLDAAGVASLALVAASCGWALGSLLSRELPRPGSLALASGLQMLMGGVVATGVATAAGEWSRFDVFAVTQIGWLSFAYLVVAGSIAGFTAYGYLLRNTTAAKAGTYAFVNPVVAVILGAIFLGERLTGRHAVAGALLVGAAAVITWGKDEVGANPPRRAPDPAATPSPRAAPPLRLPPV